MKFIGAHVSASGGVEAAPVNASEIGANAFAASEYSGGMVQNVTWVQFPKWQSIVAVEVGMANLQTKYQILFTPTGEIIRARNVTYTYNPLGAATFL